MEIVDINDMKNGKGEHTKKNVVHYYENGEKKEVHTEGYIHFEKYIDYSEARYGLLLAEKYKDYLPKHNKKERYWIGEDADPDIIPVDRKDGEIFYDKKGDTLKIRVSYPPHCQIQILNISPLWYKYLQSILDFVGINKLQDINYKIFHEYISGDKLIFYFSPNQKDRKRFVIEYDRLNEKGKKLDTEKRQKEEADKRQDIKKDIEISSGNKRVVTISSYGRKMEIYETRIGDKRYIAFELEMFPSETQYELLILKYVVEECQRSYPNAIFPREDIALIDIDNEKSMATGVMNYSTHTPPRILRISKFLQKYNLKPFNTEIGYERNGDKKRYYIDPEGNNNKIPIKFIKIVEKEAKEREDKKKKYEFDKLKNVLKQEHIKRRTDYEQRKANQDYEEYKKKIKQESQENIENRKSIQTSEKEISPNKIKVLEDEIIENKENLVNEKDISPNKIKECIESSTIFDIEAYIKQMLENIKVEIEENKKIIQERMVVEKRAEDREQKAMVVEKRAEDREQKAMVVEQRAEDREQKAMVVEQRAEDREQKAIFAEKRAEDREQKAIFAEKRAEDAYQRNSKILNEIFKNVNLPTQYKLSMLRHGYIGNRSDMEDIKKKLESAGFPSEIEDFIATKLKK